MNSPTTYAKDMELRDYFAAKVMQALITETGMTMPNFSKKAYEIADAMMAERNKE